MNQQSKFYLSLLFFLFFISCSSQKKVTTESPSPEEGLVILATSDFHSSFQRAEGMAHAIRGLKKKYGNQAIYLDAGDLFQGSMEGNQSKGKAIIDFYNLIKPDAAAMGNHELDYGIEALKQRQVEAQFPWLSANFVFKKGQNQKCDPLKTKFCNALGEKTFFLPRVVIQKPGAPRVCVIGATTPTTPSITKPEFVRGKRFETLEKTVPAEYEYFQKNEKCDYQILVVHAGLICDSGEHCLVEEPKAEILRLLKAFPDRLDAVIAGHTHLKAREIIGGTPVLEPGSHAKQVGVLRIGPQKAAQFLDWVPIEEGELDAESDVTQTLLPYREKAKEMRDRVVGEIEDPFTHRYLEEGPLGNLVVDAILAGGKKHGGAEIAITNPGGIRASWTKTGKITYGDVFSAVPFDNSLAVVKLKGSELMRLLEISFSLRSGITPIAGLKVERLNIPPSEKGPWDRDLDGDGKMETWERNLIVRVTDREGKPIDPRKIYRVATIDFLVDGAEYHRKVYDLVPKSRKRIFPEIFMRNLVEEEVKRKSLNRKIRALDYFDPANPRVLDVKKPSGQRGDRGGGGSLPGRSSV